MNGANQNRLSIALWRVVLWNSVNSFLIGFVLRIMALRHYHKSLSSLLAPERIGKRNMKTTRYFEEQVLRKRPYLRREWCQKALNEPIEKREQPDGRIRFWVFIEEIGKYLRIVTLEDGETVHNAFPDRGFIKEEHK
jgi:hypothetical protein